MSHDESTDAPDPSDLAALTSAASDTFSVRRVFGEPYEQDGSLIIPVAVVTGTHGRADAGGRGRFSDGRGPRRGGPDAPAAPDTETTEPPAEDGPESRWHGGPRHWGPRHPHPHHGQARGMGRAGAGGFATHTRPLGVYVVRDGDVSWQPALDLNRVILGGQIVGALIGTALAITVPIARALRRKR